MTTYTGGCHCGNVRYEVAMDEIKAVSCNCSHCHAKGFVLAFVPENQFSMLAGTDTETEYRFNKKTIAHRFCTNCGVQSYAKADTPEGTMVAINLRCIRDLDLDTITISPINGKEF